MTTKKASKQMATAKATKKTKKTPTTLEQQLAASLAPTSPAAVKAKEVVTMEVERVDFVALMERYLIADDKGALQQVIDGLIEPLKKMSDPELLDFAPAREYLNADKAEKEAKATKEALKSTLLREAVAAGATRFRVDEFTCLNLKSTSSSSLDLTLLDPAEQLTFETLKAKATVKSPVLALAAGK